MMSLSAIDAFGFHSQYHIQNSVGKNADEDDAIVHNISVIIGYFPLVGTIIGLIRLKLSYNTDFLDYAGYEYIQSFRLRAIFEIASLGFLLMIPDLIITLGRTLSDSLQRIEV